MKKCLLVVFVSLFCFSCREKTPLEKSNAFVEKAGWYVLREGLWIEWDSTHVPDYTKVFALADSAIKYSPNDLVFYCQKVSYCLSEDFDKKRTSHISEDNYRRIVDIYLQFIRRDTTQARGYYMLGGAYDSLGMRDSAACCYLRAMDMTRREPPAADTLTAWRRQTMMENMEKRLEVFGRD